MLVYVALIHTPQLLIMRIGLSILLVGLASYDLYRAHVPNVVVMPLMVAVIPLVAVRLLTSEMIWGQVLLIIITWLICFGLWWMHTVGAGDAKLVMTLVGIFPDNRLLLAILLSLLLGSLATLIVRSGRAGLAQSGTILIASVVAHKLPTRAEIHAAYKNRGSPTLIWISLGGLFYLWGLQ